MPHQLSTLTRLDRLDLNTVSFGGDEQPLAALSGTLWRLSIQGCASWLPACLSQMTSLRSLTVCDLNAEYEGREEDPAEDLEAALPELRHLTQLLLSTLEGLTAPPAALGSLSLHSFCWLENEYGIETDEEASLPSGPWLKSLRRLAAPAGLLRRSEELLQEARGRGLEVMNEEQYLKQDHTWSE